jgi:hypothetical protein
MKKALKFTIETQTENHETISICHLNERVIALELSPIAAKMFKLNKSLFTKINSSTKILTGVVYREGITRIKNSRNSLGTKTFNNYDHNSTKIIDLNFSNNNLQKRQSILLKNKKRVHFDPSSLVTKDGSGPLDPQNLTLDDVENSTMVCEIEEIQLFQDSGIRTYMLKDFMNDAVGLKNVSYKIEIQAETQFKEYIDFILQELKKSINFLTGYFSIASSSINYNAKTLEFTRKFKNSIFLQLGLSDNQISANIGSPRVKNSEFGKAAMNFYNGSLLLNSNVEKNIYGEILKTLLPSAITSPAKMSIAIDSFGKLLSSIKNEYNIGNLSKRSTMISQKISRKKNTIKKFISITTEIMNMDTDVLGYKVFSERQTGLNKFTTSTYNSRVRSEKTKYYPDINSTDGTNFMTSAERGNFANISNAPAYFTPASLVMGGKTITCARGMNNIDPDVIREFRLAKSSMAIQMEATVFPSGMGSTNLSRDVMSDFNLAISTPRSSILARSVVEDVDMSLDAKDYVGANSYFVTNSPNSIYRNYKRLLDQADARILAIVSDVIPGTFLSQNGSIESITDLQFSNKRSKIRGLVSEKEIDLESIPPQIKAMMSDSFQTNPNIDPLKNAESRAIMDETMKNLFLIMAHTGFELDEDGFPDLYKPILKEMSSNTLTGSPVLAKAYDYEVPQLGIVKDKFMPTIYNNLCYIRG